MKIYIPVILLLFFLVDAFGQLKPSYFPEDISIKYEEPICYCQPGVVNKSRSKGVVINYGRFSSGNYLPEAPNSTPFTASDLNAFNHLEFKIKIPVLVKERTKVLLGYSYFRERYNFETITDSFSETLTTLDNTTLKSNGFSAIFSHSISAKNYIAFRYKYSMNGNYDGWLKVDGRNAIHNFMGMYGFKKSELFEWGVGILFSKNFRRTSGLPFVLYNRTFNDKWGIEAVFPANVFLRHNIDDLTISAIGIEYASKSFRLDVEDLTGTPLDYAYNHSEILLSLKVERHISSWVWANIKVGYQYNFDSEFESKSNLTPNFQADLQSGLFFQVGFFLSPEIDEAVFFDKNK